MSLPVPVVTRQDVEPEENKLLGSKPAERQRPVDPGVPTRRQVAPGLSETPFLPYFLLFGLIGAKQRAFCLHPGMEVMYFMMFRELIAW